MKLAHFTLTKFAGCACFWWKFTHSRSVVCAHTWRTYTVYTFTSNVYVCIYIYIFVLFFLCRAKMISHQMFFGEDKSTSTNMSPSKPTRSISVALTNEAVTYRMTMGASTLFIIIIILAIAASMIPNLNIIWHITGAVWMRGVGAYWMIHSPCPWWFMILRWMV